MLDTGMLEQLKAVFSKLESKIDLVYEVSDHNDQTSLVNMLESVASTSGQIQTYPNEDAKKADYPQFKIVVEGKENGIRFNGIPTGHEFTSLILAIINSDHKGKFPDEQIAQRIRSIKGPIEVRTYVSLTCENCPDVVQTLNQMAIIHPNFKHTMIDGQYTQEEITALGIQGVPSVCVDDKMIYSGRLNMIDLLNALEKAFGKEEGQAASNSNPDLGEFDVVVVGGGPAGASAAIYSARKGLKTAVLAERVGGQVQDTKGIENLIGTKYTEGPQLAAQLLAHMKEYPITILEHRRVERIENATDKIKTLHIEGGEFIKTKSLIVATGAKWRELNVPGEKEYIGRGVAFCPHCDGPMYKGKDIAVVGGGNSGVEAAIDLAGIVKSVTVFEFNDTLKADNVLVEKLKSLPNVSIVTNAMTKEVVGDGGKVTNLTYEDRQSGERVNHELDGVFVQIGLLPNSAFVKEVVETTRFGEIVIDVKGRTNVPGIYACGDVTTVPYKQIVVAMGEGAKAALASFEDLMLQ